MITIDVQHNISDLTKWLNEIQREQIPFATAKALTQTAQDVQEEVRRQMPQRFTLRRDWIVKGIRITPATKRKLEAFIYSKDPFMGRQEHGGTKAPKHDRNLAIPINARRTKTGIIKKSELPANLVQAFRLKGKDGNTYLAVRRGRGKQIEIMYLLKPQADVKERLGLREIAFEIVNKQFNRRFIEALQGALISAR